MPAAPQRGDLVSLLRAFVAIDTSNPGGRETALAALLRDALAAHAPDELVLETVPRGTTDGAYVFARWGTPRVLLNAHIDTVPAQAGWTGDPFALRVDGERAIGLGSADTKGAIVAILGALASIAGRPRDVGVLFTGDEEVSGTCLRAAMRAGLLERVQTAIICEPTGCRPGVAHRGFASLEIEAPGGGGGHSSTADVVPAPVVDLARVTVALSEWSRARAAADPAEGLCVNAAEIRGTHSSNVIPPSATLVLSFRPPPGADVSALLDETRARIAAVAPRARVREVLAHPSVRTRNLEAFRPWLGAACDRATSLDFWTEAALVDRAGVNTIVYGPGDITLAHSADESVPLADRERARDVFAEVLSKGTPDATP
jgi:acetylornithine deacetylase